MKEGYYERCVKCHHMITEPVCKNCYLKQFILWLEDRNFNDNFSNSIIFKMRKNFTEDSINETICILCNKENVSVCTFCYFSKAQSILENAQTPYVLIEEFREMFNYYLYSDLNSLNTEGFEDVDELKYKN